VFETAILAFVLSVLALTLGPAAGRLILHTMYGPDLPSGVQPLANAFTSVYAHGATVLLALFKIFNADGGTNYSRPQFPPSSTQSLPPNEKN